PGRRVSDDSGASAVEFALVVPLLLLLVFGIINFGIIFSQQLTMNNAVREGARRAVVNDQSSSRTCDQILAAVQNDMSGLALNKTAVKIKITQNGFTNSNGCGSAYQSTSFGSGTKDNVPCKGSASGTGIPSLQVEAQYVSSIPIAFPPFPTTITLNSKAVYRCEFSA
ncbi:MAG TPA: TadE/TadG family type IV pilus assembly protein, partial [Candidatus Nanopelagicales bacterium]|nr:TadE/TadG family type IV pilus assembly protein [Candidatus Nanopelagicales bacterium]